jgi:hypothetical protein
MSWWANACVVANHRTPWLTASLRHSNGHRRAEQFPFSNHPQGPNSLCGILLFAILRSITSISLFALFLLTFYLFVCLLVYTPINADSHSSLPFNMSLLTNGGRIVPILTGSDSHPTEMPALLEASLPPIPPSSISSPQTMPLQDQQACKQAKPMHHASLEMASLQERGLYALPTEGDGKPITPVA